MTHPDILTAFVDADGECGASAAAGLAPWWSFGKTVIAAAALKLAVEGACGLDHPMEGGDFTLRQALQHRAGLPDYGGWETYRLAVAAGGDAWPPEEILRQAQARPRPYAPGEGWLYSNIGYLHVRMMIERLLGRPLGQALRALLFDPLGLETPRIAESKADLACVAWLDGAGYDPQWVYHGLVVGSPGDAARFLHALLSGSVLPAALLADMTTPFPLGREPLAGRPWRVTGYGLGLMIGEMEGVGRAVGHSGAGPGSVCAVYHFPDAPTPRVCAAFAPGETEGAAEFAVVRAALAPS